MVLFFCHRDWWKQAGERTRERLVAFGIIIRIHVGLPKSFISDSLHTMGHLMDCIRSYLLTNHNIKRIPYLGVRSRMDAASTDGSIAPSLFFPSANIPLHERNSSAQRQSTRVQRATHERAARHSTHTLQQVSGVIRVCVCPNGMFLLGARLPTARAERDACAPRRIGRLLFLLTAEARLGSMIGPELPVYCSCVVHL